MTTKPGALLIIRTMINNVRSHPRYLKIVVSERPVIAGETPLGDLSVLYQSTAE
jgi:hypothetical protein